MKLFIIITVLFLLLLATGAYLKAHYVVPSGIESVVSTTTAADGSPQK